MVTRLFRSLSIAVVLVPMALAGSGAVASQPWNADATLRVMSFNLRYGTAPDSADGWEHRRDLLLETILTFEPDLLGTQECLQFQAEFLQQRLPERGFVGVGRDDGHQAGEMCAIFYRADRFEEQAAGHFWLSETPDQVASKSWDAALTRMVSWVRLRERSSGRELVFFNTHFDHMGEMARKKSAELLARKARKIAGKLPVVVTGDFNAAADPTVDGPYCVLVGRAKPVGRRRRELIDTYRAIHPIHAPGEGTYHGFTGDSSGPRVDWILASSSWKIEGAGIDPTQRAGRYPSDHFPVTAVLGW